MQDRALRWIPLLLSTLLLVGLAASASAGLRVRSGTTHVQLDGEVLGHLGLQAEPVRARRSGEGLTFQIEPSSDLHFDAPDRNFEGFAGGALRHAGGFDLHGPGGEKIGLAGFTLRPAAAAHDLELIGPGGQRWFVLGSAQGEIDADSRRLELRNADLLLSEEMANWLGRPELRGSYAGVVNLDLALEMQPEAPGLTAPAAAASGAPDPCDPVFAGDVDVELLEINSLTQGAREAGGRVALAPSAKLRNSGVSAVMWNRAIAPDSPVGQHPYLALHFYRLHAGVLEQLGRGDLKHAFYATNTNCACRGGHDLLPTCEDVYGVSTNLNRHHLALRDELTASTGSWTGLGSHFDATPVDNIRDHEGDASHDSFEHRLLVQEPDLQTVGAEYFIEAWYLAAGDVNIFNSLGHRSVAPSLGGSTWAFPFVDTVVTQGSMLDEWVDPQNAPLGAANQVLDTGGGKIQLAVVSSDLGNGTWHYEYALMNFDFDRKVESFTVPVGPSVNVSNAGFGDADANGSNDWTPTLEAGAIRWTAPGGAELDWGTLLNFRFDANAAPATSDATIVAFEPGVGTQFAIETRAPGATAVGLFSWPWLALLAALLAATGWTPRRRRSGPA